MKKHGKIVWFVILVVAVLAAAVLAFVLMKRNRNDTVTEDFRSVVGPDGNRVETYQSEEEDISEDAAAGGQFVNNQLVLMVKDGTSEATVDRWIANFGAERVGRNDYMNTFQIRFDRHYSYNELYQLSEKLAGQSWVEEAYINELIPVSLSVLPTSGIAGSSTILERDDYPKKMNWAMDAINAKQMWAEMSRHTTTCVNVGVLDNQFYKDHEDLRFESIYQDSFNQYLDKGTHGTHVAGTIAADSGNDKGIVGLVENARLYGASMETLENHKEYNKYGVELSDYQAGLSLLIGVKNCKVVNFSYHAGYYDKEKTLRVSDQLTKGLRLLLARGHEFLITKAAGNEFSDASELYGNSTDGFGYDALQLIEDADIRSRIIVVGAAERENGQTYIADYSNYGERVDIIAPGTSIYSCTYYSAFGFIPTSDYGYMDGTSMAAPHVAGVAANVWSLNPELTGAEVKNVLCSSADGWYSYADLEYQAAQRWHYRMLDGYGAVQSVIRDMYRTQLEDEYYPERARERAEAQVDPKEWALAYKIYIENQYTDWNPDDVTYNVLHLDNDDIPEIAVRDDRGPSGWELLSYRNGKVVGYSEAWSYMRHCEGSGIIYALGGHTGYETYTVCRLTDEGFDKVGDGNTDVDYPEKSTYYWEGKQVMASKFVEEWSYISELPGMKETEYPYTFSELRDYLDEYIYW